MAYVERAGGALPGGPLEDWTLLLTFEDLAEVNALCHAVDTFEDTEEEAMSDEGCSEMEGIVGN